MKQLASRAALPAVFRLGGRLTALSTLAFTAILALASAPNAAAQLAPPPAGGGYELYFDGKRVGVEPTWTFEQAIANLNGNRKKNPAKDIQGFFKGQPIVASGAGYELYFDGKRVGTEPSWTREQGVANLTWNRKTYPAKDVRGFHKGDELAAASEPREGVGYELFFDGKRVRTETEWTFAQGITNLNGNRQSHPGVNVQASYKGDKMVSSGIGYEVYYDGKRAGTQPKWTRDQGVASLTAIRKQYPQVDIRGFYSGQQLSPAAAPLPYVPKSPGFY
ncbi:MAG: hypothetical protein NTY38_32890, partial [Acidobacteria bacterium]|nr:hypothetical protein [Acidobacteriota bacterium]